MEWGGPKKSPIWRCEGPRGRKKGGNGDGEAGLLCAKKIGGGKFLYQKDGNRNENLLAVEKEGSAAFAGSP